MEGSEDQFYICLMSNSSQTVYPNNTLSSFTNVLARACKISEDWLVGLSEIHFNPIPNGTSAPLKVNPLAESSGESDPGFDDSIEVFESKRSKRSPTKQKQKQKVVRKRRSNGSTLSIIVNTNYGIYMSSNDLTKLCYERNNMNGGALLDALPKKFRPHIFSLKNYEKHKKMQRHKC